MSTIENLRVACPYLYFASDKEIKLAQEADSPATCYATIKFLDGGKSLKLNDAGQVCGVVSNYGEELVFEAPVEVSHKDDLPKWICSIMDAAKEAANRDTRMAMGMLGDIVQQQTGPFTCDSLKTANSQALLVLKELLFTMALEEAGEDVADYCAKHRKFLDGLSDMSQSDLSKLDRAKLNSLITISVHHQDLLEADAATRSARLTTKMTEASEEEPFSVGVNGNEIPYQFNYCGHPERLVVTPLSLKAYDNHLKALATGKIGLATGPAGTGKTETIKDLCRSAGRQSIVINVSDQMTNDCLDQLFKGAAGTKAWLVFDEFNRLPAERMDYFVSLRAKNPEVVVFITCNPNFAGRIELPSALKDMALRIEMLVPDFAIIMEVMLACSGIKTAKALGKTMVKVNKDCTEKLSKQCHYDYGMRQLKTVAKAAALCRKVFSDKAEEAVVRDVVYVMYNSMLVNEDKAAFEAIIAENFPGIGGPCKPDGAKFAEANADLCLQMELLEICLSVRHGCVVLGDIAKGEQIVEALAKARGTQVFKVDATLSASELYGECKDDGWVDGCLVAAYRKMAAHEGEAVLLMSGNMTPVTVEHLNTVLDDNRVMKLANGEELPLESGKFCIFAMDCVDEMSPAFISRNGVVCIR